MTITLYYFDFPGRAEAARLLLTLGGVDFEDKRIPRSEWPSWKCKMPFGQVPVLEVDGKMLAETTAIDHYCAAITGMIPEGDPWQQAEAEQLYCFIDDIWQPLIPVMSKERSNAPEEHKVKAWRELLAPEGTFRQRLSKLDKMMANRQGKFVAGDKLTYVDLSLFGSLSVFNSGIPRIPKGFLSDFPALKSFRHAVASLPEVEAYYSKQSDEMRQTGFMPDKTPTAAAAPTAAEGPGEDASTGSQEQQEHEVTEATERLDLHPEGKTIEA